MTLQSKHNTLARQPLNTGCYWRSELLNLNYDNLKALLGHRDDFFIEFKREWNSKVNLSVSSLTHPHAQMKHKTHNKKIQLIM